MSDDDLGLKQELPEGDLFNLHGDGSLAVVLRLAERCPKGNCEGSARLPSIDPQGCIQSASVSVYRSMKRLLLA